MKISDYVFVKCLYTRVPASDFLTKSVVYYFANISVLNLIHAILNAVFG